MYKVSYKIVVFFYYFMYVFVVRKVWFLEDINRVFGEMVIVFFFLFRIVILGVRGEFYYLLVCNNFLYRDILILFMNKSLYIKFLIF